jgi:hypothetical protein
VEIASNDLVLGTKTLRQGRRRLANLCVQDAARSVATALADLEEKQRRSAAALLEEAITEQAFVRPLISRAAADDSNSALEPALLHMLCHAQERVIGKALPFPQALAADAAAQEDVDLQMEPWTTIIRLFNEGFDEAAAVPRHLALDRPEWSQADLRQELALEKWREALKLLQDPEDQSQNQAPEEPPSASQSRPQPAPSPAALFDLLQQMDQEDRPAKPATVPLRRGLRPW